MFSFVDNGTVDAISDVPEQFQGLYKEGDGGKFSIDTENPATKGAVEAVLALNKSLTDARKEASDHKAARSDLSILSEYGSGPEEILASFKTKTDELNRQIAGEGDAKLSFDKYKEDSDKAHSTVVKGKDKQIKALTDQLYGQMVTAQATEAITTAKGDPLLLDFVLKHVKVQAKDGKFEVLVVDERDQLRHSPTTGENMSVIELVGEMKNDPRYGKFFETEIKPGGGGGTPPGGSPRTTVDAGTERTSQQKLAAGLAKRGGV